MRFLFHKQWLIMIEKVNIKNLLPVSKVVQIVQRYLPNEKMLHLLAMPDNKKQLISLLMTEQEITEKMAEEYIEQLLIWLHINNNTNANGKKVNLSWKGPLRFLTDMLSIYQWNSLWDWGSLSREGVNWVSLPNQYGNAVVYSLPDELTTILKKTSWTIWDIIKQYKIANPGTTIDYVVYDKNNLHMSIAQSWFVDDKSDLQSASDNYPEIAFNDLPILLQEVVSTKDSIVLKTKPFPFPHIINQLIAKNKFSHWDIHKLWRWTQITIGRFVGNCNDQELIQRINKEITLLNDELKIKFPKRITLIWSEAKCMTLNHYFNSSWGSKFILSPK